MYTNLFLLRISHLNSIESELDTRRLLFLGRLITEQNMSPTVRHLFRTRSDFLFNADLVSPGFLPEILIKYDPQFSTFTCYENWMEIVKAKIREKEKLFGKLFALITQVSKLIRPGETMFPHLSFGP